MGDDRRSVKTYVPEYQKSEWEHHAEELGMSQSEFVRTMVQAGRRGFTLESPKNPEETDPKGGNPGESGLETRVETLLDQGAMSWEQLRSEIADDLDDRLEEALGSLQERNRVQYSGRDGGYVLTDE